MTEPRGRRIWSHFECSALPQFQFPIWVKNDRGLFYLRDVDLPMLATHIEKRGMGSLERSGLPLICMFFIHQPVGLRLFAPFGCISADISSGFETMPDEVAESLRRGEMANVQEVCGWERFEFHPNGKIALAAGVDGHRYYFDEQGKPCGHQAPGGEYEPWSGPA